MPSVTRLYTCPYCGHEMRLPWSWVLGVEIVFGCDGCRRRFKTGYKSGAALSALGLALALATVNLGVWLFSSLSLPLFVLAVLPLWVLYAFLLRRWRLSAKYRKLAAKQAPDDFAG